MDTTTDGTSKPGRQSKVKVLPFGPPEAHLMNTVNVDKCHICGKWSDDSMVLLRTGDKVFSMSCLDHPGVIQEFFSQFQRIPFGWKQVIPEE